uniref:Zgc:172182 n=1 Tax=Oryzias latipes TaxID=8090 RepID=A0A3P9JW23_ORYLA
KSSSRELPISLSFKNPLTFAIDDLEEKKMLRSRIEEQSKLILLLKHRADETLLRYLAMQNINSELNDQVAQMQNELISKTEHIEALEIRCNDLAIDKNTMEFQKKQSVQLMRENQQGGKTACSDGIKQKRKHIKCQKREKQTSENEKKQNNTEEEIRQLEVKWKEEKKGRIEAQKRSFELEAEAAVNTDLRVKSLQSDLEESKDFKALTEHSTNLLEQERNLNKRLRDAIGQI